MNKTVSLLALSFAVLSAGFCRGATAESAHNAQKNAYDAELTAYWQRQPDSKRLGFEMAQLKASRSSPAGRSVQQNIIASTELPTDELERIQNEN